MTMPAQEPAAPTGDAPNLAAIAGALADLLERETALVRNMQIAKIAPLQADKSRLTQLFQKALKPRDDAPAPTALSGRAKTEWLAAGTRLARAAMENEQALRVGRAATEHVVAAIVAAVKLSRRPPNGYAARHAPVPAPRVAGIAIDHRL
ncbi:MAG TPA: hypothetical protein VMU87_06470 [Stellaceae bacterium]|nr:hypothetical protein [Stellaceae bacterium]